MDSLSRRPKKIAVGSHKAPTSESACFDHKLAVGAKPSTDTPQERGSNLPVWMNERRAEASNGIPRQEAERPESSEEFMTAEEAAALLRVSSRTIRRLLKLGGIPFVRIGRLVRIPRSRLLNGVAKE